MNSSQKVRAAFKNIPSVDRILERYKNNLNSAPYSLYINTIRIVLNSIRTEIKNGNIIPNIPNYTYKECVTMTYKENNSLAALPWTFVA